MAKKKRKKKKPSARTDFARVSVVKEYLAGKGFRTSADSVDVLNGEIQRILDVAADRAQAHNRVTVSAADI